MKNRKVAGLTALLLIVVAVFLVSGCEPKVTMSEDSRPGLFLSLPDYCNTPDAMTMDSNGDIILACPNYNNTDHPGILMKIDKQNKLSLLYTFPVYPGSTRTCPMGLDFGPDGNLYVADNQYFNNTEHKSRLLRVVMENGKPVRTEVAVDGFKLSNAVIWKGDDIYVSDTFFDNPEKPGMSGIYKISLDDMNKGTVMLKPNASDKRLIASFTTIPNHRNDAAGADGLTFDSEGNLYTGMFGDGAMYKISFNADGTVKSNDQLFRDPDMPSVDGIFYDAKRDIIFVTDSERNAIHLVTTDGKHSLLWLNEDNDGSGGLLDQPCEPLVRGNELIIVNFDMPFPGLKNSEHNADIHTLSVIQLKD